ncbi:MAG: heme o synthase [Bdellovibrionota bacterium]
MLHLLSQLYHQDNWSLAFRLLRSVILTAETLSTELKRSASQAGWKDYLNLTKPTITLLVVVTAVPGVLLASQTQLPSALLFFAVIIGSGLLSASAAAFNQIVEQDIDKVMARTERRSLPAGKVPRLNAISFGLLLGIAGFFVLFQCATPMAAYVGLAGHIFYVVIYTLILKPRTAQNIVIGGAAGAVGPLIGWAAVTNSLGWPAWVMFLIIFFWTPPHFWALALKYKKDYAKAGIPMYPVIYGDHKTRRSMMIYSFLLIPCIFSLYYFDAAGLWFLLIAMPLTLKFALDATKLYLAKDNAKAMALFHFSCIYTLLVFVVLAIEKSFC